MAASSTPLRPALTFLGIMALYLVVEIGYNAWLLEVAGSGVPDPDKLHRLELFGRALAATGFTLMSLTLAFGGAGYRLSGRGSLALAAGLIGLGMVPFAFAGEWGTGLADGSGDWLVLPVLGLLLLPLAWKLRGRAVAGALSLALVVGLSTFTGMFHGQLLAIERWVVDASSAEERWQARHLNLLKAGYAAGVVRLGDVGREEGDDLLPEERTLLAFTGVMFAGNDDPLFEHARQRQSEIIGAVVERNASADLDARYEAYREAADQFIETKWEAFSDNVKRHDETVANAHAEAAEAWNDSLEAVNAGWRDYQQAQRDYEQKIREAVPEIYSNMEDFIEEKQRCDAKYTVRRDVCNNRLKETYKQEIRALVGQHIPWEAWCREAERGEAFRARWREERAIDLSTLFGGGEEVVFCPAEPEFLQSVLEEELEPGFREDSGGYPSDLESIGQFRGQQATADMVRERMARDGVDLPSGWTLADRDGFLRSVAGQVESLARSRWEQETREAFGEVIEPVHDYERFEAHPAVQAQLRREFDMEDDQRVRLTLDREGYREQFVVPAIEREIEAEQRALQNPNHYADGGRYEEDGRQAMRGLWIPAISLSLSLFFGLLGTAKVVVSLIGVALRRPLASRPRGVGLAVMGGLWGVFLVMILVLPFGADNRLTGSQLYQAYQEDLRELAPARARALNWLLHTQPVVAPIGDRIKAAGAAMAPDVALPALERSAPSEGEASAEAEASPQSIVVRVERANLRQGHTTQSPVVGRVTRGMELEVRREATGAEQGMVWYQVMPADDRGWIREDLVEVRD